MQKNERAELGKVLEGQLFPFRIIRERRIAKLRKEGWLRCVRLAAGIPVNEVARRLGVTCWEVNRLEKSERKSRIMLETLGNAAKGLGCELVYALVPLEGTLKEMAEEQEGQRAEKLEKIREQRESERRLKRGTSLEEIGWQETFYKALRTQLRSEGFRVRPSKTDRGKEKAVAEFKEKIKMVGRMNRARAVERTKGDAEPAAS